MEWVDNFLNHINAVQDNVLKVEIGGVPVVVAFNEELKEFFNENRALLIRIGKDTFKSFLALIHENRDEEAFLLLLQKMSIDEIIARMKQNAAALTKANDEMEAFIAKVKEFLKNAMLRIATKALLGILA